MEYKVSVLEYLLAPYKHLMTTLKNDSVAVEKKWYKSLTVWFNVAILILTSVNEFAKILPIPPEYVTLALTVGNLLLRIKTSLPVKF